MPRSGRHSSSHNRSTSSHAPPSGPDAGYYERAREPLASLALLLPLLVFHELGVLYAEVGPADPAPSTVEAYRWIEQGIARFGLIGAAPAILTLVLLVGLHIWRGASWTFSPKLPALMFAESIAWMAPLLIGQAVLGAAVFAVAAGSADWVGLLNIAIGAGLYEELLFRLIIVGGLHWVLTTVVGMEGWRPGAIAVGVSATLFALYHDLSPDQGRDVAGLFLLYAAGGVYFGVLYLLRGFGITATTHALYDVCVLFVASDVSL